MPSVAICIATHNRLAELTRSLLKLHALEPPPSEILVAADGCTDGTVEFLQQQYPAIRLLIHQQSLGSIGSRNALAAETACDILLSFDDDSYPLERDLVAQVQRLFTDHPKMAVLSFAQRTDEHPETLTLSSFGEPLRVGSYANSAAAIRRSAFVALGGYPGFFFHMYEEPDFALRCAAADWIVRYEPSLTVRHHFTLLQRDEIRTHQRHARNEQWSVLMRCPLPQLPAVAFFRAARQFGYAWSRGWRWVAREPVWWLAFFAGISQCLRERHPLPWPAYLAWMKLVRCPAPVLPPASAPVIARMP